MTQATLTLTDFLLARVDEDERRARSFRRMTPFTPPMPVVWHEGGRHFIGDPSELRSEISDDEYRALIEQCSTPADPDPRVLAECEAKRRIVALHEHPDGSCWEMHRGEYPADWPEDAPWGKAGTSWAHPSLEPQEVHPGPCETLQLLALPYADHPDYRDEWRP